jgi:uncharacterized protein YajQ (UPF0234 family)
MAKEYILYVKSVFEDVPNYELMAVSSIDKKRIENFLSKAFKDLPNKFFIGEFEFELWVQDDKTIEYFSDDSGLTIMSPAEFVFEEIPKVKKRRIILKTET